MIRSLVRIIDIFEKKDYLNFILLGTVILLNSFLEVLGIGLLLPFIAILGKPDLVTKNGVISRVYNYFHFQSFSQFMIIIAAGVAAVFIMKNVLIYFSTFWQTRFLFEKKISLKASLFRMYLTRPYAFHLKSNFARLQRNLELVDVIILNLVLQLFFVFTELVVVIGLFLMLVWAQPFFTLAATVLLGGMLYLYFHYTRDKLHQWGVAGSQHRTSVNQQVNQGLGSIKEVKILGKEEFFVDRYQYHAKNVSWEEAKGEVLGRFPRLLIEVIVVSLVMLVVICSFLDGGFPEKIFVTLSLFAIVAIRLMPSLTRISTGWSSIRFYSPCLDDVYDDLILSKKETTNKSFSEKQVPVVFKRDIKLENIVFSYENCSRPTLENVSFTIPKNTMAGFVGASGAGKTTTIDIIAGLLNPSQGQVLVDGLDINSDLRSWQDQIGYIPQNIYLSNDTIKTNVAFGTKEKDIDEATVWRVLCLAQLDEFVAGLPDGLDTVVGERGIRLSGGQRQRIGIARALYHDPEVLIMDEATAALDNETERAFMTSLERLSGLKTILIIAHRLTTIRACDVIFFLKAGRIVGLGNYDELLEKCPEFQGMAGTGISIKAE